MKEVATDGFLQDESRLMGNADRVVLAQSEADMGTSLREAQAMQCPITLQGGLTGITGAGVPDGGMILSMRDMTAIKGIRMDADGYTLTVEPGCTLDFVRRLLEAPDQYEPQGWSAEALAAWQQVCDGPTQMFAPDLTEPGATIGGVVSTNGSGARSYYYGPARQHVTALRVVLMGGEILTVRRGREQARGLSFALESEAGRTYRGQIPAYDLPAVKHAGGLYAHADMDLLDVFVGAEGILGAVSEVEIRLVPRPEAAVGLTAFLPDEASAVAWVQALRASRLPLMAMEYFGAEALTLLRTCRADLESVALPELPDHWHTAIYIELPDGQPETLASVLEKLEAAGGNADDTWFSEGYDAIETVKGIRHAIPESVNRLIAERRQHWPEMTKLGTDLAVPDARLKDALQMYHADLRAADLAYVIFGHIGNNHLHVNILPRDAADWRKGKALYGDWARRVVAWGGTISAEHGVGKLKREMLHDMYGAEGIRAMQAVKRVFDPAWLLNRGTLVPIPEGS